MFTMTEVHAIEEAIRQSASEDGASLKAMDRLKNTTSVWLQD